jgi:sugar phosphate isomerase/epimerase
MKLAFSTLGCPRWDWDDVIAAAGDVGYDGVEIRGLFRELYAPRLSVFAPENLAKTRRTLERMHLEIPCLTSFADLGCDAGFEAAVQEARDYIDTAARIGTPYVRVMGDPLAEPHGEVDINKVADRLTELSDYIADRPVTALLETNGWFADSRRMKQVMDRVNRPNVAVLWDIHHPYRFFGEAPAQTAEVLGGLIRHVHIKDSVMEQGKLRYRMINDGDLPIDEAVAALKALGYQGHLSMEWNKRFDDTLEEPGVVFAQFVYAMKDKL